MEYKNTNIVLKSEYISIAYIYATMLFQIYLHNLWWPPLFVTTIISDVWKTTLITMLTHLQAVSSSLYITSLPLHICSSRLYNNCNNFLGGKSKTRQEIAKALTVIHYSLHVNQIFRLWYI